MFRTVFDGPDERTQEIWIGQSYSGKPSRTNFLCEKEFLNSFRNKYCTDHQSDYNGST